MSDNLKSANIDLYDEATISSISSFLGTIISLLLVVVVANYLTVEQVGEFFFYLTLVYLFSQVSKGFALAVRKRVSSVSKNKNGYYFSGFILLILYSVFAVIILVALELVFTNYTKIPVNRIELFLTGLVAVSKGFNIYNTKYYAGCGYPGKSENIRNYIGRGSQVILIFLLLNFVQSSIIMALIGYGIGALLSAVTVIILSPLRYKKPTLDKVRSVAEFSKWSIPNSILNDFYQRFDTIILSIMVGSIAVGFYDSSVRLATFGFAFAHGIASASNVKISGLYELDKDIIEVVKSTVSVSTIFVYPTLIISILHAETILQVSFGSEYIGAEYYLIAIIVYQILQAYRLQFESILNAVDKPSKITHASIVAVVFNILTAPFLVIYIGGIGAVISTLISEVFRHIVFQYQIKQQLEKYIFTKSMFRQPIISSVILGIVYGFNTLINLSPIQSLIIDSLIVIILFFSATYIASSESRDLINSLLNYMSPINNSS